MGLHMYGWGHGQWAMESVGSGQGSQWELEAVSWVCESQWMGVWMDEGLGSGRWSQWAVEAVPWVCG